MLRSFDWTLNGGKCCCSQSKTWPHTFKWTMSGSTLPQVGCAWSEIARVQFLGECAIKFCLFWSRSFKYKWSHFWLKWAPSPQLPILLLLEPWKSRSDIGSYPMFLFTTADHSCSCPFVFDVVPSYWSQQSVLCLPSLLLIHSTGAHGIRRPLPLSGPVHPPLLLFLCLLISGPWALSLSTSDLPLFGGHFA